VKKANTPPLLSLCHARAVLRDNSLLRKIKFFALSVLPGIIAQLENMRVTLVSLANTLTRMARNHATAVRQVDSPLRLIK